MKLITSSQNTYIKNLQKLQEKSRERKKQGLFLVEGKREISLAIKGGYTIDTGEIIETSLEEDQIFTLKVDKNRTKISFALPNVKVGSVIEYVVSFVTPYATINDWYFQDTIPKIKSEFDAAILGNYTYNIRFIGFLKLDKDEASTKKNCITIPIIGQGNCSILSYGMNDIPAFKEEKYMLSKKNYQSRISFELKTYVAVDGRMTKYTKDWKSTDKRLKKDFLNNQTNKKRFFQKQLSTEITNTVNQLDKSKKIFYFIQNHYTWNDKRWSNSKMDIKKAFTEKIGGIGEINLSLYNSLQSVGIESYIVLTATRNKGIPTKLHPIIYDFNYIIVKAIIDGKEYFLDATNKFNPFGFVSYMALNGKGRVLNFKKGSYWQAITPLKKTSKKIKVKLVLTKELNFSGDLSVTYNGYRAAKQREIYHENGNEEYLNLFETENTDIEAESLQVTNLDDLEKPLKENYKINIETAINEHNILRITPFLYKRITINPFKLKARTYPVDFGYKQSTTYLLNLTIPKNYTIKKTPKNKAFSLPNKSGKILLNYGVTGNEINVYLKYQLNKKAFNSKEYPYLKEFYNQLIKIQNSYIEIQKKE